MKVEFDQQKRAETLLNRGIDFAHAHLVFEGFHFTVEDDRIAYGETRYQTIGRLRRKVVMVVWTFRGSARRIISMRECNVKERESYQARVGRSR